MAAQNGAMVAPLTKCASLQQQRCARDPTAQSADMCVRREVVMTPLRDSRVPRVGPRLGFRHFQLPKVRCYRHSVMPTVIWWVNIMC